MTRYELVNSDRTLAEAVEVISSAGVIALDTEADSRFHYPERLCLLQVLAASRVFIIDTIVLQSVNALGRALQDDSKVKILHGADYDIRSLHRHAHLSIRNLFDTAIAARFCGMSRFGLADVIRECLHTTIAKSPSLQKADWGKRPLSLPALDYAAGDVTYLLPLREVLSGRLKDLGRASWVAEECARLQEIRYVPPDPETAYLSVKGAGRLDGRALAILRSLHRLREQEAFRLHRPPFFVIPDPVLLLLATEPNVELTRIVALNEATRRQLGGRLRAAIEEGLASSPIKRIVHQYERPTEVQLQRLAALKNWRSALGARLSLDPSLLWPAASLERLARHPATYPEELVCAEVRTWQRQEFSASLQGCLGSLPQD
jgi:ribonuclease D